MSTYSLVTRVNGRTDTYSITRTTWNPKTREFDREELWLSLIEFKQLSAVQLMLCNCSNNLDIMTARESVDAFDFILMQRFNSKREKLAALITTGEVA